MKKTLLIAALLCSSFAFAQKREKNGTIYKRHPYIDVIKSLASLYQKGDADGMTRYYADTVKFFGMSRYKVDSTMTRKRLSENSKNLMEAKAGWQQIIDGWDIKMVFLDEPVGLEYANAQFAVQSWWELTLVNKKTKKTAVVQMVMLDIFNKDGKIGRQIQCYDPTPLIIAMR